MNEKAEKIWSANDRGSLTRALGCLLHEWRDPEVHEAVLEAVEKFPETVMEILNWALAGEAFGQYRDVIVKALKASGWLLRYVPCEHRDIGLCAYAVLTSGAALELVPIENRTDEICLTAASWSSSGLPITHFPERLLTEEVLLPIVRDTGGRAFAFIPQEKRTMALCREAVRLERWNFSLVPQELRTEELCLEAVKDCPENVREIPPRLMSADFCERLMEANPAAIKEIPGKYLSWKVCYKAVSRDKELIRYIPVEKTSKAFLTYVESLSWE